MYHVEKHGVGAHIDISDADFRVDSLLSDCDTTGFPSDKY